MLAAQLALVLLEPEFCIGCAIFLGGVAVTSGSFARIPIPGGAEAPLLLRGALRVGFGGVAAAFGLIATAAFLAPLSPSEKAGAYPPGGIPESGKEELEKFVGKASGEFLLREGQRTTASSSVLVVGVPACPACENAYRELGNRLDQPVLFVRPLDDTRDVSQWFPYPADTLASPYRCTESIGTAPIIVITDAAGKVTWGQAFWRTLADDQAAFIAEVSRRLTTEGNSR